MVVTNVIWGSRFRIHHRVADTYRAGRQVVEMTDRLTRLATLPRAARPIRNTAISLVGRIPSVQRALAMRLSGLVNR
jgi:hypothetical protein